MPGRRRTRNELNEQQELEEINGKPMRSKRSRSNPTTATVTNDTKNKTKQTKGETPKRKGAKVARKIKFDPRQESSVVETINNNATPSTSNNFEGTQCKKSDRKKDRYDAIAKSNPAVIDMNISDGVEVNVDPREDSEFGTESDESDREQTVTTPRSAQEDDDRNEDRSDQDVRNVVNNNDTAGFSGLLADTNLKKMFETIY